METIIDTWGRGRSLGGKRAAEVVKQKYIDAYNANPNFCLNCGKKIEILVCGYDKHIEVCHIKAVSEFSDDDLVKDINSIDNLIGLCSNHHWELDHGVLELHGTAG